MSMAIIALFHPWEKNSPNCFSNLTDFLCILKIILIGVLADAFSARNIIFIKNTSLLSGNKCPEKILFIRTSKSRLNTEFSVHRVRK